MNVIEDDKPWYKCDACGRFVSFEDIGSGKAKRAMTLPDSDYSAETYETLCAICCDKEGFKALTKVMNEH